MRRRAERRLSSPDESGRLEVLTGRGRPLRVADVALFYGERSGGIRTYLREKAAYAGRSRDFEHHVVVPGRIERHEHG
jgi:cytosine/adenosine deaminase-related metal-dependent hydrolase